MAARSPVNRSQRRLLARALDAFKMHSINCRSMFLGIPSRQARESKDAAACTSSEVGVNQPKEESSVRLPSENNDCRCHEY